MEKHLGFLERRCRLCGKTFSRVKTIQKCDKTALQSELLNFFGVDIELDSREIHPQKVCSACRRIVYHLNSGNLDPETSEWRKQGIKLFVWKEHSSNCYCLQHQKGRRSKKELKKRKHDSDTESGKEAESENEKDGCLTFNQLMDKLSKLDKELALTLSCKLTEYFNFLLVDLDNIDQSIASIQRGTLLQLTDSIFRLETEKVKKDILSCSQTYKSLPGLLQLRPDSWMEGRNEVLSHAVGALCHSGIKDVQKAVAVDQLCSLVQPSYVSPFLFGANLLVYSIARSKLAMNIYSKFFPAGGSSTVRAWLNRLTMDVQQMPSGDILTSIDNDQVLIKKWTVRKENRAQISILTSVCAAEIDQAGVEQRKKSLAPSQWDNRRDGARCNNEAKSILIQQCMEDEADKELLRQENKKIIHEMLQKIMKEQTNVNGQWMDDVDGRVQELKEKEGTRVCPMCQTVMEKSRRKCINPVCKVSLKDAEKELQGSDVLGTALVAPIREFRSKVKETRFGFTIDPNEEASVTVREQVTDCYDEFVHVPSSHHNHPIKVTAGDPIFVNPNSFDSLKDVFRRIGTSCKVNRYHPNDPDAREWVSVTMDGLPYLVSIQVIENVLICTECCGEVLKENVQKHCVEVHQGQRCKCLQEFGWVVLRIGKLHMEMNMARHFMDMNWDVFLNHLASELGFVSEAAQKYVRKGSDHHKTMSVLKVAHLGLWQEMLIPYVRERLSEGLSVSVNDYLYTWLPENGKQDPTYFYMFEMTWTYLMGLQVFRMGVRRNNANYVKAGQVVFAPIFHRSSASKYALIDLHDRLNRVSYPEELRRFIERTESVSSSGNPSKGEDMDACLEEVNKESKTWQHGTMTAMDWLRIFRNLENLTQVRKWLFSLIGLANPKDEAVESRRKYDFADEVLAWRIKLRKERYFMQCDPHQHMSLGGKVLDHELRNFQRICSMNRKSLLVKHLIDGDKRQAIGIQPVYVTTEERSVAEYIGNSTKEEIVRRADEKLQLLSDEEVKSDLMKKLADFKRQIARIKKDTLLALYEEITEELNNADVLEMVCQSVEIEEDGD